MTASVVGALEALSPSRRDVPAYVEGARAWSVDDLLRAAVRVAGALRAAGAGPGSLWATRGESGPAALAGSLGARLSGVVPVLEGPGGDGVPGVAGRVRLDASLGVLGCERVGDGVALPRETAWVRTTGGTTGRPRLVAFTEAQSLAGIRSSIARLSLEPGQAVATTVPPWTAYGWNSGTLVPLLAGCVVRTVPPVSPRGLVEAPVPAWAVTTGPVVRALARVLGGGRGGDAPVRVLVAGGPYPEAEARALLDRGVEVIDRYGATEVGPIAQAREPLGALSPAPGVAVRVAHDAPVLEVTGPSVSLGYVGAAPFCGTFRTPDVAAFGADGTFRLVRRADRAIKRMGRVVDLAHVERQVARAPGVALARVLVEPGALDVAVVAQAVPRGGAEVDARAVLAWLGERLDPWERPARLEVVPRPPAGAESKWAGAGEEAFA